MTHVSEGGEELLRGDDNRGFADECLHMYLESFAAYVKAQEFPATISNLSISVFHEKVMKGAAPRVRGRQFLNTGFEKLLGIFQRHFYRISTYRGVGHGHQKRTIVRRKGKNLVTENDLSRYNSCNRDRISNCTSNSSLETSSASARSRSSS